MLMIRAPPLVLLDWLALSSESSKRSLQQRASKNEYLSEQRVTNWNMTQALSARFGQFPAGRLTKR